MPGLFDPLSIGSIEAKNRVFMAPMTRARASKEGVPTDIMVTYYRQRAGAGLIITEGTGISREGLGWAFAPGIWNEEQVRAWKPITQAVHEKGGKIVLQLWHMGRAVHSNVTGMQPVSASETAMPGLIHTYIGKLETETARALTKEDIARITKDYGHAAKNAIAAGFDGVELHAANGYLIDQFLRTSSNFRTDEYGGSVENRIRLLKEVVVELISAVGRERVGVRFSPNGDSQGVIDDDPKTVFLPAARMLSNLGIAFLESRENSKTGTFWGATDQEPLQKELRKVFKNVLVLNQEYERETAVEAIENGTADAISFARKFIANPDLVEKLRHNKPLRSFNDPAKMFYAQTPDGYINFPEGSD